MTKRKIRLMVAAVAALTAEVAAPVLTSPVFAAPPQFTQAYLRLDRMAATTVTGGTVCAKPATTAVEADVQITFPTQTGTDFVVDATAANWTVTTTNLPAGSTPWVGINTATNVTG